jgi:nitrogen fixation NifU-like protein
VSDAGRPPAPDARTEALYQELILDHHRRPRNRGELADATARASVRNPLCGDEVAMAVAVRGGVVREARFTGQGCAISRAAASLLTEAVRGRAAAEAAALVRDYAAMVGDPRAPAAERLGQLGALRGVARVPGRVRCALLPAEALARALEAPAGGETRREEPGDGA